MSIACPQQPQKASGSSETSKATWLVLYRNHWAAVYARCKRLLRDHHAAEDAAQETFVRALRHVDHLPDSEDQRRWLFRVASNYCLNQMRDSKRRAELLRGVDAVISEDFAATVMNRAVAERLIRRVPDRTRSVAWLVYIEEMQQHQVARELGISRRTVVNRLAAARAGLRSALSR